MAALTDDINVEEKDGVVLESPMAVDVIFRGALLMMNAAGFIAPAAAEAGNRFAGLSRDKLDNSGGSAGDLKIKYNTGSMALLTGTGFAQTDVGVKVYASDDQTITKTFAANLPYVGLIEQFVSSTQVWVKMQEHASIGEAAIADTANAALSASTLALSTADTYTDAAVNTAVNAAVDAVIAELETRLDATDVIVDLVLAALRTERVIQG